MLDLTTIPATSSSPEAVSEVQTPIEWPNEQNDDVLEYQDAFDFGSGRLTARTLLDFSEWDRDSPVSGSYDVSVDEDATTWESELLLETEDDGGSEMTLKSMVEFRSDASGKAFETHISFRAQSPGLAETPAEAPETPAEPSAFTFSFFFDFI
ncbi:hypothetical protein CLG85_015065 [Yangia mangrovi]|uniref:Uncharacterized protein n=1 Tax=Alloyangia mangrovi TaxID=1779329 RepID=A0A2A3K0V0_9RHOB|nr:hypothetical protein [Alloyangia mangrovi]MCT4371567.1 hypothetical protein [Alloyangia mangrovi]